MPRGIYKRRVSGKNIPCEICGVEKWYKPSQQGDKHFFCSREHRCVYQKENGSWNKGVKGYKQPKISIALTGRKASPEARLKMSLFRTGLLKDEKNPSWKGDEVSYISLHQWVRRKLGTPGECAYCGKGERIEWASVSHKAKRDLNDYIPLCPKCHRNYDKRPRGEEVSKHDKRLYRST